MDYDEAWRKAAAAADAFNRRDLDALQAGLHEDVTHQTPFTAQHLGQEDGRVDGKEAHREFVRWLWGREPQMRSVLEEVFTGPHGYASLILREDTGGQVIFVHEVDADGLVGACGCTARDRRRADPPAPARSMPGTARPVSSWPRQARQSPPWPTVRAPWPRTPITLTSVHQALHAPSAESARIEVNSSYWRGCAY